MEIIKNIHHCEKVPFFYGKICPCYHMFDTWQYAILPLNFIIKFWYWTLRKIRPTKWDIKLENIKDKLYKEGYNEGFKAGERKINSDFIYRNFTIKRY